MKPIKTSLLILLHLAFIISYGQNAGFVGINTSTPKAALDIHSVNSGIQLPRVSRFERLSMSPTHGTIVFDTSAGCLAYWNAYKNEGKGAWVLLCGNNASPIARCKNISLTFDDTNPKTIDFSSIDNESTAGGLTNTISSYTLSKDTFDYCDINTNQQTVLTITNDLGVTDQCTSRVYLNDSNTNNSTTTPFNNALLFNKKFTNNASSIEALFQRNSALSKFEYAFSSAVTFSYDKTTTNNMAIWSQEGSGTIANNSFMTLYIKNDKLKFRVGKISVNDNVNDYHEFTLENLEATKKYSVMVTYDGNGLTNNDSTFGRSSYTITLMDFENKSIIASSKSDGDWVTIKDKDSSGPLSHENIEGLLKLGNSNAYGQLLGKIAAMGITSKYIDCNYELLNFATNPILWVNSQQNETHPNLEGDSNTYTFKTNNKANKIETANNTQIWLMGDSSVCDFAQNLGIRNFIFKNCQKSGGNYNAADGHAPDTALVLTNDNSKKENF